MKTIPVEKTNHDEKMDICYTCFANVLRETEIRVWEEARQIVRSFGHSCPAGGCDCLQMQERLGDQLYLKGQGRANHG